MTGFTAGESSWKRAQSVHNTRPWLLEFHDEYVSLYERLDHALPRHDPLGRDRLISCGAALEHVRLAMRAASAPATARRRPVPSVTRVSAPSPRTTWLDRHGRAL